MSRIDACLSACMRLYITKITILTQNRFPCFSVGHTVARWKAMQRLLKVPYLVKGRKFGRAASPARVTPSERALDTQGPQHRDRASCLSKACGPSAVWRIAMQQLSSPRFLPRCSLEACVPLGRMQPSTADLNPCEPCISCRGFILRTCDYTPNVAGNQ